MKFSTEACYHNFKALHTVHINAYSTCLCSYKDQSECGHNLSWWEFCYQINHQQELATIVFQQNARECAAKHHYLPVNWTLSTCFNVTIFQGTIITVLQVKSGTYWHEIRASTISIVRCDCNSQNNNHQFAFKKIVIFAYVVVTH